MGGGRAGHVASHRAGVGVRVVVVAAGAFAAERLADRIEVIEIVRQLGDVDQAVDLGIVEFDEQAEAGDRAQNL